MVRDHESQPIAPSQIKTDKLERLEFLETLLLFRGWFTRADLHWEFNTAPAVATRDIKKYKDLLSNTDSVYLDGSSKRYIFCQNSFKPVFERTSERALSFLRKISKQKNLGAFEGITIETPLRIVQADLHNITAFSRAIFNKKGLSITYISSREGQETRTVFPHALFDGGMQWYARAYSVCGDDKAGFVDIALSRVISSTELEEQPLEEFEARYDIQWNKIIRLEIAAHPNLAHPRSIEYQYQMTNGIKELTVRAAIAGYWLRHWNVDCSENHCLPPKVYQLWLRNPQTLYDVESVDLVPSERDYPVTQTDT